VRSGKGGAQPGGIDPPEVVLGPVHEGDRDLLAISTDEFGVGIHVAGGVGVPGLRADRGHQLDRLIAEVATRPGQHHNPGKRILYHPELRLAAYHLAKSVTSKVGP
jgi:hypothetical protein